MVAVTGVLVILSAHAQESDAEHRSHHPDVYGEQSQSEPGNTKGGPGKQPSSGNGMGAGMGAGMGKMMDGMMEKMGAPKPKDLYPSLMRLPELPEEKREEVLTKAVGRMQAGTAIMVQGFDALSRADSRQDFTRMQSAVLEIEQGLSQYNSGLAAKRALTEGQAPRRVALEWFKREMNLLPTVSSHEPPRFLGMTPLHTGIMLVLIAFAVTMIWMYVFKMRRAGALMEELRQQSLTNAEVSPKTPEDSQKESPSANTDDVSNNVVPSDNMPTAVAPKTGPYTGPLRVIGIFIETHDVKTFRLAQPDGEQLPFNYEPGQFVTFSLSIPGQEKIVKRSYTIASSPSQRDYMEVTIKREEHGLVSRHMHDTVKLNDLLEIKAPNGKFYFNGQGANSVMLISGGVGITPMMSAVRYLTATCWEGDIYFIFSARTTHDFIFEQELLYLQRRHSNLHVLISMTRAEGTTWMGPQGRLTPSLIKDFVPDLVSKVAHICGPPPMMDAITNMLQELGMPKNSIKTEAFGSAPPKKKSTSPTVSSAKVSAEASTHEVKFVASGKQGKSGPEETILDVAEALDVDIESSCRAGSCGSCKVKLLSGSVEMDVDDGLEDEDKAGGYILACQAIPSTPVEVEA
ncbi:MAG TPA: 2Fe-2S iron-sulfur cluster binding domain-containing protein [Alphaproteobacteria bacterium]|nr:2Fe-2S iron-sulfur cluster binding domain-containing protein [Pseudoalteromonas shioyasakiensis]HIC72694.1 2Fe-2S iron-sulfur cluster binding domain-containing protein [Alphaproteobacteria bacterium]